MLGIYKTGAMCSVVMLHEVSRYGNDEGNKITALLYVQHRLIEGSAMSATYMPVWQYVYVCKKAFLLVSTWVRLRQDVYPVCNSCCSRSKAKQLVSAHTQL